MHVESMGEPVLRGRAGRHCGQKRTYRAVSDHDNEDDNRVVSDDDNEDDLTKRSDHQSS